MLDPMLLIPLVMTSAGLFGGLINYYLSPAEDAPKANLFGSLALGVGASFMVPLFLNMISSNLLDLIRGSDRVPADLSKLYVFAGFCLVAAISSKAFIHTLSDRILREARETRRQAEATNHGLVEVKAAIQPIIDKETEPDSDVVMMLGHEANLTHDTTKEMDTDSEVVVMVEREGRVSTDSPEERLLSALVPGRWTLRSLSGLAKEAGLDHVQASRLLDELTQRGLVGRQTGSNGPRWFITEEGRKRIGSF